MAKKEGLSAVMNYFSKVKPEFVCLNYKKIESNLKAFLDSTTEKLLTKYTDYNYPEDLLEWFNFERDEKTEGVINLLKDYNPILITDLNILKDAKREHKVIIFYNIGWR